MNNFDIAVESTATALDSAGSAAKENAAAMDSIEMRIKTLQASFQRLVNGEGGLNSFVKGMISTATAIVDFVNKIGGLKTVLTTLASAGIIVAIANFEKLIKASKLLKAQFIDLVTYIPSQVTKALMTLDDATIGLATAEEVAAANATLLKVALSGAVAVIGIAIIAWQNYKRAQEEAHQAALDASQAYQEQQKSIDETSQNILSEASAREELYKVIKDKLGDAYDQEKEDLKDINELREEALRLMYEEAQQNAQELQRTTGSDYQKSKDYLGNSVYDTWNMPQTPSFSDTLMLNATPEEALKSISEELDKLNQKRQAGIELTREEKIIEEDLSSAYVDLKEKIDDAKSIIEAYDNAVQVLSQTFEDWLKGEEEVAEAVEESSNQMEQLAEIVDKLGYESYDDFAKAIEDAGGSLDDFYDALDEGADSAEEYAKNILNVIDSASELNSSIEETKEALSSLQEVVDQYNESGQFTADMVKQLSELSPEYVAALQLENGQLVVNTELLQTQFEVQKQLALINVEIAKQLAITAYCEQTLGDETENTTTKLQEDEQQAYDLSTAYSNLTDAANKAAAAINRVRAEGKDDADFYAGLNEIRKTFDDMKDAIKDTEIETKKLGDTTNRTSKAGAKAAKDTADAYKEAFESEKKVLEHMHEMGEISDEEFYEALLALNEKYFGEASGNHEKYLEEYRKNEEAVYKGLVSAYKDKVKKQKDAAIKAIDKVIDATKKQKDAALKAVDDQINALKKQKDAALKAIDAEIKTLEKAKDARHKFYQEKIDALQKAHDLQEQINKLEEYENQLAQAKAQRVWVMKDGQFQLGENESAVSGAEQQLSDYKDEMDYEQQLQELQDLQAYWDEYYDALIEKKEEYREYLEEYYDSQIEALEEYKDQLEEYYDEMLEALEEQKDLTEEQYDEMLENYEEHTKAMMEAFKKFIEDNKSKFEQSLNDLRAFVEEWNALVNSMESIGGLGGISVATHSEGAAEIGAYASGNNSSVKDNEIALVGESPNTEMLIGSKVNSGVIAKLHKGSGVVNAESTKTLAGLLNNLGKNKPIEGGGTNNGTTTQNFTFGSISLPNVTDATSFVDALRTTFGSYSIQYANCKA